MVVQNVQFIPIYNNTLARLMVFMVIENFWSIASFSLTQPGLKYIFRLALLEKNAFLVTNLMEVEFSIALLLPCLN